MLFWDIGTFSLAYALFNHSWTVQPSLSGVDKSMQSWNNLSIAILASACRELEYVTKREMGDLVMLVRASDLL